MWFRRKQRNRRLSREHVLDVQLRSSVVRAARSRRVALALGASFGVLFGVYLLWRIGNWGLNQLLYENRSFAIREIEVQTDGVISLEQLRRWAGVKRGANLLALNIADVKRNLEYVPFIVSAAVERVLPSTLRLRVVEREPIAQVNLPRLRPGGGLDILTYQFDEDGFLMPPLDRRFCSAPASPNATTLPVLVGVNPNELQPGRRIESPSIQAALQFLVAFESSPMIGLVDLRRVDVGAHDVLVVTTGSGGVITLGLQDFERQLLRWREIHDAGARYQKVIASLDLAVTNNIPAHWIKAGSVQSGSQKSAQSSRAKRKHV